MHSAIEEGLYRIQILRRRHPFWSYPRRVNNSWPAGLTKAEVSPSVCTALSLSVYCYTGMCFHPVTSWLWPTVNPSFLALILRLQKVQNNAARLILRISKREHISPHHNRVNLRTKNDTRKAFGKNKIYIMIFVDLEKAYDWETRDIIWWTIRKKNVREEYIKVIQDMYDGCRPYNISKNANGINGELWGESWSTSRFGTKPIAVHH